MKRMTASAVMCVVVVLLGSSAYAVGDGPLDAKGTVAYVSEVQRGCAIFLANADGSRQRQLTRQRTRYEGVSVIALSPSGSRIAWTGGFPNLSEKAYADIYVIPTAGGTAQRLTHTRDEDWYPAWSPDGQKLAFDRQDNRFNNWIYVMNADGTSVRRVTENFNWYPTWSSDGHITFVNRRGLWMMNPDVTGKRLLANVAMRITPRFAVPPPIAWSPDGTQVAFTTGRALWVMDANGLHHRKLHEAPNRRTEGPVWSPNGTTIAWTQGDGDLEVFLIDADGSGLRNLTHNDHIHDSEPTWSPDGRALAFLRDREAKSDVYVMNADGSGQRNLSETLRGDWSPAWLPR